MFKTVKLRPHQGRKLARGCFCYKRMMALPSSCEAKVIDLVKPLAMDLLMLKG